MNELDFKATVLWLLSIVMALFGFIWRRHVREFDELKAKAVTHDRLSAAIEKIDEAFELMRDDRHRMHEENRADLQHIRSRVDALADRRGH